MKEIGKYKIIKIIGKGGMGVVYQAEDTVAERIVALKMMSKSSLDLHTDKKRFLREVETISQLRHPNIVELYYVGEHEKLPYFAMEYLEGKDLKDYLEQGPTLPSKRVLDIMIDVCNALEVAHQKGIIHRDIKPGNIYILNNGGTKLMDFGLAKTSNSSLTKAGMVLGTIFYLSPEQIQQKKIDHRTDIYSLGIVLYQMLSHKLPYQGNSLGIVLNKILYLEPKPCIPIEHDFPEKIQEVLLKAIAKDKEKRYLSASEFAAELKNVRSLLSKQIDSEDTLVGETDASPTKIRSDATPATVKTQLSPGQVTEQASVKRQFSGGQSTRPVTSFLQLMDQKKRTKIYVIAGALALTLFILNLMYFIQKNRSLVPAADQMSVVQEMSKPLKNTDQQSMISQSQDFDQEEDGLQTTTPLPDEDISSLPEFTESDNRTPHVEAIAERKPTSHLQPGKERGKKTDDTSVNVDLWKLQGHNAYTKGQYETCIENMNKILEHDPDNTYAWDMKTKSEAKLQLERKATSPQFQNTLKMKIAFERGRLDECLNLCQKIQADDPLNQDARDYQKKILRIQQQKDQKEIARFNTINDAKHHLNNKNYVFALQMIEQLLKDYPADKEIMALQQEVLQKRHADIHPTPTPLIRGIKHKLPERAENNLKVELYMGIINRQVRTTAWLYYRSGKSTTWKRMQMKKIGKYLKGEIPAYDVKTPAIEYYFLVRDEKGEILYSGEKRPYRLTVNP